MDGSLLMTNKDVIQRFLMIVECIVSGHDAATRIAKEDIHPFVFKGAHQSLCTCYLFHILVYDSYASLVCTCHTLGVCTESL